jgi:hypothetical protein
MPPAAVKTIRDLIFWQYAKLISESAGEGKANYGFIMNRFKSLQSGKLVWSGSIREFLKEREVAGSCVYCGAKGSLAVDHLIPRSRGGPDSGDNAVMACRTCNSSKGDKGVYEWFGLEGRDAVPRVAEGKYLKLLFTLHETGGTLDIDRKRLPQLCGHCEQGHLCTEGTQLSVYCLESVLMKGAAP